HQVCPYDRRVSYGIALAVFQENARRRIAGKLRQAVGEAVVLQVAAPEQLMLSSAVQGIIELSDVRVPIERSRCLKDESRRVERIARGRAVRQRVSLDQGQHCRVLANAQRVKRLHLIRIQLSRAAVSPRVTENAVAEVRGRNGADRTQRLAAIPPAF